MNTASDRAAARQQKTEARARMDRAIAEAQLVVSTGKCPVCGGKLRRNLSMAGWWQCEQYGAPTFRARPGEASCGWQAFTE